MKILGIETSCDETALSIIEAQGGLENPQFEVLSNSVLSQIKTHEKYGGVFPMIAKREHARNLTPLLKKTLEESGLLLNLKPETLKESPEKQSEKIKKIREILEREPELFDQLAIFLPTIEKPGLDVIGVTYGPGLEPALWVGINFARALSVWWDMPIIPINHMEGHIFSVLLNKKESQILNPTLPVKLEFPALSLLISGGHTELILIEDWMKYQIIGKTRDDAVGEAFDKVARMLSLPYPGGPEISRLTAQERATGSNEPAYPLPRPMIHSKDFDFSFSGLKTAVLYTLKEIPEVTEKIKGQIAREFEDTVVEVLITKTKRALEKYQVKSLILGGGVIANTQIRNAFIAIQKEYPEVSLLIPDMSITTDNALMIAIATYIRATKNPELLDTRNIDIKAVGHMEL